MYEIAALVFVLFLFGIPIVEAQSPQNATSITNLIKEKYNRGTKIPGLEQAEYFVQVRYESPTTVVLEGDLIGSQVSGYFFNSDLWSAMDLIKNQYGFKQTQIFTSGMGSQGNPTVVYIVLTK
jgi:hypothetical protein